MIILAMLIGFIALISAINALFATLFGLSFQQILGYVFYPLAWLIGIPLSDALNAGSIMATKLVANEFVAMIELQKDCRQHDSSRARHSLGIPGVVCQLCLDRHYRRGDQRPGMNRRAISSPASACGWCIAPRW